MTVAITIRTFLLCGLICFSSGASAQGCGNGVPSAGNPMCIPPDAVGSPYGSGEGGGGSGAAWRSYWGALARDEKDSVIGVAEYSASRRRATKLALSDCKSKGGTGCVILVTYKNQCATVVMGSRSYYVNAGAAVSDAAEDGLRNCAASDQGCRVAYSNCNLAERVN